MPKRTFLFTLLVSTFLYSNVSSASTMCDVRVHVNPGTAKELRGYDSVSFKFQNYISYAIYGDNIKTGSTLSIKMPCSSYVLSASPEYQTEEVSFFAKDPVPIGTYCYNGEDNYYTISSKSPQTGPITFPQDFHKC